MKIRIDNLDDDSLDLNELEFKERVTRKKNHKRTENTVRTDKYKKGNNDARSNKSNDAE